MSMMDLGAALGAAPGAAAPGAAAPPGAEAVAPPMEVPPEEAAPQFENSLDALDAAEEALQAFIQLDPDEADRAIAARCLQEIIKLKAANQQSAQSGDLKSLQRALVGGASAIGGPGGAGAY